MHRIKRAVSALWPFTIPLAILVYWIGSGHISVVRYLDGFSTMSMSSRLEQSLMFGVLMMLIWIGMLMIYGSVRANRLSAKKVKLTEEKIKSISKSIPRIMIPYYVRLSKRYPEDYVRWVMTHFAIGTKFKVIREFAKESHESWAERPLSIDDKSVHIACHVMTMHLLGGAITSVSIREFGTEYEFQYVLPGKLSLEDTLWVESVSLISPIAYLGSSQKSLIYFDALKTSSLAIQLSAIGKSPSHKRIDTDVDTILKSARESARSMIINQEDKLVPLADLIKSKKTMNSQQVKKALREIGFNA